MPPSPQVSIPSQRAAPKLSLLLALYVSQAVPLGFFIEAVPAIGRSLGASLAQIGMIQALALPYMIKFLWAPLIDGRGSNSQGHYRSWLIPLQASAVAIVALVAILDPSENTRIVLCLGGLFMLLAATQDIATDGLAVRLLAAGERAIGNAAQVGGYYLGQILGGGLLLILFSRLGWAAAIGTMALLLAVPLGILRGFKEPQPDQLQGSQRVDFRALARFFTRPGSLVWILVLLLFRSGDAMAITMMKPMLVDQGYSLDQLAWIVILGNSASAFLGAWAGARLIDRLGRRRSMALFAAVQGLAIVSFILPALRIGGLQVVWATSMLVAFTGAMATTALYTHMMDRSSTDHPGTDFTLQQSLAAIGPLIGASLSGLLATQLGFPTHFAACALFSLSVAALVATKLKTGLERSPST